MHKKPEIMSPAGHWPQLHAAIEAGADAVYFGLTQFSARAKVGFTLAELPEVMRTLHRRGVKGYVTFNTLMFDTELEAATQMALAIADAGADALILQDVGMAHRLRALLPEVELHGSTQMSLTSAEGVAFAAQLGLKRVVLARELALDEIAAIRQASALELEIFAHGALCVSYSGQCFSSEAWGGRSANRGQCAQACRLPYELLVDGALRPLAEARYLLSPGDLYALPLMPRIVELGVAALKIEGRYKDAAYVALTTAAYRKAVDEAWAGLPLSITRREAIQLEQVYSRGMGSFFLSGTNHQAVVQGRAPRHRGVLVGRVVRVLTASVLVEPVADVAAVAPLKAGDGLVFDAAAWRSPEEREEGGRVYHVHAARDGLLELEFGYDDLDLRRIRSGDLLWRTHDPELDRVVRPLLQPAAPVRRQPLHVRAYARVGAPLELTWRLIANPDIQVTVRSTEPLGAARQRGLSAAYLEEQLGRLGTTPYELAELELDITGEPFAPSSWLNNLRREATEALAERQGERRRFGDAETRGDGEAGTRGESEHQVSQHLPPLSRNAGEGGRGVRAIPSTPIINLSAPSLSRNAGEGGRGVRAIPSTPITNLPVSSSPATRERRGPVGEPVEPEPAEGRPGGEGHLAHPNTPSVAADSHTITSPSPTTWERGPGGEGHPVTPQLHLLVRTSEQLTAALALRPASITLDYLDLYGLRPAVEQVQAAGIAVRVASPRILKPNEERIVSFLRALNCPILVRSSGLLHTLDTESVIEIHGDFSLNIANVLSARHFLAMGLTRITPTHDLNAAQISHLAQTLGPAPLEVIAYQHLPVFHSEHCVFCRFLSKGSSYRDCGHPCATQRIALRDQHGRAHPVMADVGCRNTVFGAEAQEASRHLEAWRTVGISAYRIEFVHENAAQVTAISNAFTAALHGEISSSELTRRLRQSSPAGTTEGSLFVA